MIWKKKSRACKQEKKEEAAVRRSPMDAASTRLWSGSSPLERRMRDSRGMRSKRKERPILLGTRMQTVKVVEAEISIREEMDRTNEKVLVPHADSSNRCKRMKFCERELEEGGDWQERERRNSQRTQGLLQKTARGRTQSGGKVASSRTAEGWKKRKKKKKNMKYRRRKWWMKCKEPTISLSITRMKKDRKKKEIKNSERRPKAGQALGKFGKVALSLPDHGDRIG